MSLRSGKKPHLTVNNISIPAQRKGAPENMPGTTWWEISAVSAGKLMSSIFSGKRPPRPGYEIRMPDSVHKGYAGFWTIYNRAGKYELMFYYR